MSGTYSVDVAREQLAACRVPDYFLGFTRALDSARLLDDVLDYLDSPYKWAHEFALWMDCDCPEFDDDPLFSEWVAKVGEL